MNENDNNNNNKNNNQNLDIKEEDHFDHDNDNDDDNNEQEQEKEKEKKRSVTQHLLVVLNNNEQQCLVSRSSQKLMNICQKNTSKMVNNKTDLELVKLLDSSNVVVDHQASKAALVAVDTRNKLSHQLFTLSLLEFICNLLNSTNSKIAEYQFKGNADLFFPSVIYLSFSS